MIRLFALLVGVCGFVGVPEPARACAGISTKGAVCTRVVVLGAGPQAVCRWSFGFRAAEAEDRFAELDGALQVCFGAARPAEPGVNHPDSYRQRVYGAGGPDVSVALKDKGGLSETLVFLRGPEAVLFPGGGSQ